MSPALRANAVIRTVRALADPALRVAYVLDWLRAGPAAEVATTLDAIAARAEQAQDAAREALVAIVDALNAEDSREIVQWLREEAAGESLLALERLLRAPHAGARSSLLPADPNEDRVPDYGKGRPLTLGERKALARRPTREMVERLVLDPHPDVIRALLQSPRVVEDDVVRLASKRPCRPAVLTEIARSTRWVHRARIRMAVVLNPDTPIEIAGAMVGLLMRQELRLVIESTRVSPAVRALCVEHLERRPPVEGEQDHDIVH